jgi:hypothetical protein
MYSLNSLSQINTATLKLQFSVTGPSPITPFTSYTGCLKIGKTITRKKMSFNCAYLTIISRFQFNLTAMYKLR